MLFRRKNNHSLPVPKEAPSLGRQTRDWTKGSILGNLCGLWWPMAVSSLVETLGPTVDMIWVAKLGAAAVASVGVAGTAVMLVNATRQGLNTSLKALISRSVGAGNIQEAQHAVQQAVIISVLFAIVCAIIGIFFSEAILRLLGVEPDVIRIGASYMRIQFVGSIFMSLAMMVRGTMQASGDSVTPMKLVIATRIIHVCLCPFLIFGWWFFPRLETNGAAITSIIAEGMVGAGIGLWILFTGGTRVRLTLRNFRFDGNMIWRMVKIGIPSSINGMERNLASFLVLWFIAPFGTVAVAGHYLVNRVSNFVHMPGAGLGQAAGVLAGQNLGAKQPERAERTAWLSASLYTFAMVISSLAVWFWAENLVRIFNTEPSLVEITSSFLRIELVSYLLFGFTMVVSDCLNGVGDTLTVMIITLITMWGVQMPLAYLLPRVTNLGVYGIRWALVTGMVVRAITYIIYFKTGRWKRKQV